MILAIIAASIPALVYPEVPPADDNAFAVLKERALRDQDQKEIKSYLTANRRPIEAARNRATIECIEAGKFGPPNFELVVQVADTGRILKVVYSPQAASARCMAQHLNAVALPEPPRAVTLYWPTSFPSERKP